MTCNLRIKIICFLAIRNLWYQLKIYKMPQKYGGHITNSILRNNQRYHYCKIIDFSVKIIDYSTRHTYNIKITNEGLKYLTNATTINLRGCDKITDEGLKYLTNATIINLFCCDKMKD